MLQVLDDTEKDLVAVRASKAFTQKDYDKLLPLINYKLDKYEKLQMYLEMESFEGWNPKAFWENVEFDHNHTKDFKRVAMVGDKKWEEYLGQIMKPFSAAEVRFFHMSRKNEAKTWLRT